jgi:hypothetical protein
MVMALVVRVVRGNLFNGSRHLRDGQDASACSSALSEYASTHSAECP